MYRIILLCIVFSNFVVAQPTRSKDEGIWFMYFGQSKLNKDWGIHHEVQYRSHQLLPNTEQILLRVGVNRFIDEQNSLSIGYANIQNYPPDTPLNQPNLKEHRIWQQAIFRHKLGKTGIEHRYRFEQRWLNNQDMRLRSRYRVSATRVLKDKVFVSAYNELFMGNDPISYDRNRLYGALGYQLDKNTNLQVGLMRQQTAASSKMYAQIAFFQTFNFNK